MVPGCCNFLTVTDAPQHGVESGKWKKEQSRGQINCRQQKTKWSVLWKRWSLTLK